MYISLSVTEQVKIIDMVGFGTQPAGGTEGVAAPAMTSNDSIQRKRSGGRTIDTDSNLDDVAAASADLTPKGTVDPPEP